MQNQTTLMPKSPTVQTRKTVGGANVHTQERGCEGESEGGAKVTEAQSKPRERKEREWRLKERGQGSRGEERRAGVQSNVLRRGRKRKREESAQASNLRLRAVHAGKTGNVNEETSLDESRTNPELEPEPEPKRGGLSRALQTEKALGRSVRIGTRPLMSSTFQKIRELLEQKHRRERTTESRREGERGREREGEKERGSEKEGEREKGSEQEGEAEMEGHAEKNGGREMGIEGTADWGKLTYDNEKKETDNKTGAAEPKERGDEQTLKGGVKDSGGEGLTSGSVEEETDVSLDGDRGERRSWCPWDAAPSGQPDVLQSQSTPVSHRKPSDMGPGGEETEREGIWRQRMASFELCDKNKPLLSHHPAAQAVRRVTEGSTGSLEQEEEEEVNVLDCSSPSPLPLILRPGMWAEGLNPMTSSSEEEEEGDIDVTGEETD
ncbi:hypothetical protein SKAU_G00031960 [Synaphobranchus kaupii]|uniref:Uncharacterized protein n=1 Tax=Synaphobranchus kaupii TaxID=118154 RepID=A0A9Q1GEX8_SYNKA|nr:hypothetical protein SKAU_G00031960 [Synaphobranchus kaupii]